MALNRISQYGFDAFYRPFYRCAQARQALPAHNGDLQSKHNVRLTDAHHDNPTAICPAPAPDYLGNIAVNSPSDLAGLAGHECPYVMTFMEHGDINCGGSEGVVFQNAQSTRCASGSVSRMVTWHPVL